jgi:hypothetical protein
VPLRVEPHQAVPEHHAEHDEDEDRQQRRDHDEHGSAIF